MSKRIKLTVELNLGEYEKLFSLFHEDITENRELAKCRFLQGEIDKPRLDWHLGHAKWTEKIMNKFKVPR